MNIVVFGPQKRIIDWLWFPKFKSSGKLINLSADDIAAKLDFDRLDI